MISKFLTYTAGVDEFFIKVAPLLLLIIAIFEIYANHQFTAFILAIAAIITHTQSMIYEKLIKINKFHDELKTKASELLND